MLRNIILKMFSIILIMCNLNTFNINEKNTAAQQLNNYPSDLNTQVTELNSVISLDNEATPFAGYIYIGSFYAGHRVFYNKDKQGAYHDWKTSEEFFSVPSSAAVHDVFKYKDKVVCVYGKEGGEDEIAIYSKDLELYKQMSLDGSFYPEYIYQNFCYGFSYNSKEKLLKSINLDTLEVKTLYTGKNGDDFNVIISYNGEIIIYKDSAGSKTCYYKYSNGLLTPILETKLSSPLSYGPAGMIYLESYASDTTQSLVLWNGNNSRIIAAIKTDDMNPWLFQNGILGSIIIDKDFIITIHQLAEEPYILIQKNGSRACKKKLLKKWEFTEADMERNCETFSGIYYEDGQVINYFFSQKAGMLQTQVIDINNEVER